jgi:hypothetical protein
MQKRLTLLSIIAFTLLLITPIAFATVKDIVVKQDVFDETSVISASSPDGWQIFRIPQKCKIEVVELYIMKNGSITGFTLGFYYWNTSAGTLGTQIYTQNFTSIPTTYTKTNYTLSTPVLLNSSAYTYALYLKPLGGNTSNDFIGVKISIRNPYSGGSFWTGGVELGSGNWDLYFILYGELIADPEAIVLQWLPAIITIAMLGIAFSMLDKLSKSR